jgi:hypothetical protein
LTREQSSEHQDRYLCFKPLLLTLSVLSSLLPRLCFLDLGPPTSTFLHELGFTRGLFTCETLASRFLFRFTELSLLFASLVGQTHLFFLLFRADASRFFFSRTAFALSADPLLGLALAPLGLFTRALFLCGQSCLDGGVRSYTRLDEGVGEITSRVDLDLQLGNKLTCLMCCDGRDTEQGMGHATVKSTTCDEVNAQIRIRSSQPPPRNHGDQYKFDVQM